MAKSTTTLAVVVLSLAVGWVSPVFSGEAQPGSAQGVCPAFHLLDAEGNVIDPVHGTNADRPYSPKQTCGKCHNYETITKGYHFTMGKGRDPTPDQADRCRWVLSPGQYGGTWSTPGPLFRYLSPKKNKSPKTMDLTSFSFITAGCGACHPGGGSTELDREGKRYDRWMADPASGLTPGGENNFDGDYYKARWSETGVLEADCLLCHLPEYDIGKRRKQIKALNFRWAATAGAGLATVTGSVEAGTPVKVDYDASKFNPDGTLSPHIVLEPRNDICLACHAGRGWKNRGANFRPRTDVHLRAGLKCIDCHPAGSHATDPRINGYQQHQIGKGDDPGGHVRDDLDNTCRTCQTCHSTGEFGAPIPKHEDLPMVHLEKISCQACHIPWRFVKSAQVMASDVLNPGAKIPKGGKQLWTFYGPDMRYWNHFGELAMEGFDDKPTHLYRPVYFRYKGMIYPGTRAHTAWPAIEIEGKPGLMQPRMRDIYGMWASHKSDPTKYPELSKIADDNGDGVSEVNRPEEIDALIAAVTERLRDVGYPLAGKRVVWACDERVYESGTKFRTLAKHRWEASPYGNTHTYNHGVLPARAALGANGCGDCHSEDSPFFFCNTVKYPFDTATAKPMVEPMREAMGYGPNIPRAKTPAAYWTGVAFKYLTIVVMAGLVLHILLDAWRRLRKAKGRSKGSA